MIMKKYIGFLICLFALSACDDGEMAFETFDFSEATSNFCDTNKLLYKINNNEALVIQINNATDAFPFKNIIGEKTINISASNKVFYRTFDNTVTANYFCSAIPPVSPVVTSEYMTPDVSNGTIVITTTLVPGATTLAQAKYLHSIVFKNITFTNSNGGTIVYDELNFGTYQTNSNVEFAYTNLPVQTCAPASGKLFKVIDSNLANTSTIENVNKFLEINIPISSFPTAVTNVPVKLFLNETSGISAIYRIYSGDVTSADYCGQVSTLIKQEEWKAKEGVDASSDIDDTGFFEISASLNPGTTNLVYTIFLRKFTFDRAFPVDTSGSPIATFTNTADVNFGTISLPQ